MNAVSDAGNHDRSVNLSLIVYYTQYTAFNTAFKKAFNKATQHSFVTSSNVTFSN